MAPQLTAGLKNVVRYLYRVYMCRVYMNYILARR